MAKPKIVEKRSDFSGGINVAAAGDTLNDNELTVCVNARVEAFGGIMRRPGSVIMTQLLSNSGGLVNEPLDIVAIKQWDGPVGKQLFARADGLSWFFTNGAGFGAWTEQSTLALNGAGDFATFRDNTPGAPLVLYIAAVGLFKWTGSVMTQVQGVAVGSPKPTCVRALGARLFINDMNNPKTLWWSAIGDGSTFTGGAGISGPGSSLVDTLSGDQIIALETLGSSLFIGTNESIARFSGSGDDIQIQQDSAGVSTEIGPCNTNNSPLAWARIEQLIALYSDRGAYIATEGGVLSIGDKVQHPNATALHMSTTAANANNEFAPPIVGINRRRSEIWFAYIPVGGTARTNVLVYNYRRQCWVGLFIYNFGITCFATYEDDDAIESIICGCDDARIRLLDRPTADSFDDGTTDFDCEVEFAPFGLSDPMILKSLEHVFLQVQGTHTFTVTATGDFGETDTGSFVS